MKIYGDMKSGNCLKVKWTAETLGIPFTWQTVDIMSGETRTANYLERFPFGQVPTVEFADGRTLVQSNAIIRYMAHDSRLLPGDAFAAAKVDEWLFWEQYSHEPYIAVCRFHMVYKAQSKETRESWRVERGEAALDLMDRHLAHRDWFAGETMTVADIALLAYTRVAHEGGFDLSGRVHLRRWIARAETELNLTGAA
ncbi:MAG: glutathione S-transferase family protein [Rhodomicrobium sp.]|nr:glutathione S-transferase family protein [Rhodomicrobium sp.]